jgi:carbamoyl-phosphate synthase large subunit
VLGRPRHEIVYDESTLASYIDRATQVSPEHPVLVDQFLDDAWRFDVDRALRRQRALPRWA